MEQVISGTSMEVNEEMQGKYLTFWTAGQLLGIPITLVVQIVGMQEITPMPEFPHYAKGVINLRGQIIPVIDMRLRLGQEEAPYNERTCIIVTDIGGTAIGFIVDEVDEVTPVSDDIISESPKVANSQATYVTGIARLEGKIALLVDAPQLVGDADLAAFQM